MIRAASSLPAVNAEQILFVLRSADFQLATDQNFSKLFAGTNYLTAAITADVFILGYIID